MKKIVFLLLFFIVMVPFQAVAQQWELDPAHTNFFFEVKHTYAAVRGQFMDFTGDVYFDPANLTKSKFDFVIKVKSIDTKIGKRDTHLRSPDFFDASQYPLMTYKSSKVLYAGANKYIVEGKLTIKDVTRDLSLEFVYHGQKDNPVKPGQTVTGLDARLTLDRLEYNVGDGKFYKMGVVGKDVDIMITLEMLR
ncbi:MAG: polyisoprenoid-binding protein [Desulfobacterales bacterium]|nr:polyisoprenoid-binding protein [Desulfobacterales bacterium]